MSILDDILKMVDDSEEFTDSEKKSLKAECKEAYDMEMGGAE
jgi:hypothetical protein